MINWKLRFKNKTTLVAIVLGIISFVYYALDLFGVIPPFAEDQIVKLATMAIDILVLLGVVVDPTTEGITDSTRALSYTVPSDDKPAKL